MKSAGGKEKGDRFSPVLIVRCDGDTRYRDVYQLLQIATEVGFLTWELRVGKNTLFPFGEGKGGRYGS